MKKFMFLVVAIVAIANFCFAQKGDSINISQLKKNCHIDTVFDNEGKVVEININYKYRFLSPCQIDKLKRIEKEKGHYSSRKICINFSKLEKNKDSISFFDIRTKGATFFLKKNGDLILFFKGNSFPQEFIFTSNVSYQEWQNPNDYWVDQNWKELNKFKKKLSKIINKL